METAIFFHFCFTRYNHDHRKQEDLMRAMEESPRGCEEEERARNTVVGGKNDQEEGTHQKV